MDTAYQPVTIGVAGAHSTGKTTFLNHLRAVLELEGRRVAIVGSLASAARARGFPILHRHTHASTLWLITAGISDELHAGLTADVVLVDRPAPDALGYYLAALQHRGELAPPAWLAYLTALVRHHAATYDLLLATRLDPSIPLGTSKPRDPDPHFRMLADAHIHAVLALLAIPTQPLGSNDHEATLARALSVCGARLPTHLQPPSRHI